MSVEELALKLPRQDKIRLMEALWNDLSNSPEELESPKWHSSVLKDTEARYINDEEKPIDWDEAKKTLLNRR